MIKFVDLSPGDSKYHDGAYRRGYQHGYNQALDDIRNFSAKDCDKFADGELASWRGELPMSESLPPPRLKR